MYLITKTTRNGEGEIFQVTKGQDLNGQPFTNLAAAKKRAQDWLEYDVSDSIERDEFLARSGVGFSSIDFYGVESHSYNILEISVIHEIT